MSRFVLAFASALALTACPLTLPGSKDSGGTTEPTETTETPETTETTEPAETAETAETGGDTATMTVPPSPFPDLKRGVWTYVEVPGMTCGNGAVTGIGVNPGDDPYQLVTVVAGGGACWDYWSCFVFNTAVNVSSGWDGDQLPAEVAPLDASPMFDRTDPKNPWANSTFVLVPYCTGDLHMGASVQYYDPFAPTRALHHAGAANMSAALDRTVAELPAAERVWVVGFSAGGYGAQFHTDTFASRWPTADLALLADCSPLVTPWGYRYSEWLNAWDVTFPAGCKDCTSDFGAILDTHRAALPDARFGLIATRDDLVVTVVMGYPLGEYFAWAVDGLVGSRYVADDRANAFVVDTNEHVLLGNLTRVGPNGVVLGDWVDGWRDDEAGWTDEN